MFPDSVLKLGEHGKRIWCKAQLRSHIRCQTEATRFGNRPIRTQTKKKLQRSIQECRQRLHSRGNLTQHALQIQNRDMKPGASGKFQPDVNPLRLNPR